MPTSVTQENQQLKNRLFRQYQQLPVSELQKDNQKWNEVQDIHNLPLIEMANFADFVTVQFQKQATYEQKMQDAQTMINEMPTYKLSRCNEATFGNLAYTIMCMQDIDLDISENLYYAFKKHMLTPLNKTSFKFLYFFMAVVFYMCLCYFLFQI